MRHPIYPSYCIADTGFLLANFGLQNLLVYGALFMLQAYRIMCEEKLLSADEGYLTCKGKVRYRVIPGLF